MERIRQKARTRTHKQLSASKNKKKKKEGVALLLLQVTSELIICVSLSPPPNHRGIPYLSFFSSFFFFARIHIIVFFFPLSVLSARLTYCFTTLSFPLTGVHAGAHILESYQHQTCVTGSNTLKRISFSCLFVCLFIIIVYFFFFFFFFFLSSPLTVRVYTAAPRPHL